ncbi:DUF2071 domain-containing protein [Chitinophaga sp. YIM B06452]|uniref:DUF2071 domain-containing protein n=1 Tax=Chitinophaga sp. YIM B06452 TaxID=3082158 RepID=UPI0031FEB55D
MKIPVIKGVIDRRILINFTAEPTVVQAMLPSCFRPKIHNGKAIVGVCLIRLKQVRPKGFPAFTGVSSENGAHRFAVEWDEDGVVKEGVYIPRRDTSSRLNAFLGGRFFPGKHHRADFNVEESGGNFRVSFSSDDDTRIAITAKIADHFPADSVFSSLEEASAFFEKGSVGYSPGRDAGLDGLKLYAYRWEVQPLEVSEIHSSYFKDKAVCFDNALLMTNIEHEWMGMGEK